MRVWDWLFIFLQDALLKYISSDRDRDHDSHVCKYAYMHVCFYVRMYVCMYACMYVFMYVK